MVRKILAKDKGALKEPLKLQEPIKDTLGAFKYTPDVHFPGSRCKKGPEMVNQPGKIRDNSEDWKKAK